ncbi:tannase/feruloyl esterase family alpha/beta hydrolase [Bradyrhizobium sp. BR 10289]|nr:tannase/feruloyl esterase family alpha/beta hydrolase [Bradyrhizobium sp. BR 10289]
MRSVKIDHVRIDVADDQRPGLFAAPDGQQLTDMPAFCRVHGTAQPVMGSKIGFEIWLPETGWNGKLEMFGNGGYSSKIAYSSLAEQLKRGYAVAGTDTGHQGDDPDFAAGHPEAIVDWAHRAVHETILAAKAVVVARYGETAHHAYFSGCSTGGHQAFMEAQRYPADFDGIIAGDPGHNRTHLNAGFLWQFVANRKGPGAAPIIPPAKLATVSAAVLKACRGRDGGLATDKFLMDPEACDFKPKDILCKAGDQADCLSEAEAEALERMYRGARNPKSGEAIYYAWPKGSENSGHVVKSLPGWSLYWADPSHPDKPARSNFWKIWAFDDANWDWASFDFDRDMKAVDDKLAATINAMDANLSAFRASGGKMIHYHGLADPVVPPRDSIDYFEAVQRALAKSDTASVTTSADFYRLFLAPGMEHCKGGEGPNVIDAQRALEVWVEQKTAPDRIMATKFVNDETSQGIALTRPLCPYPQQSRYDGRGNPNEATSFSCTDGHRYPDPLTAPAYRR